MVFPAETGAQIRRRMLDICQDHVRKILEAVRELPLILSSYQKGNMNEVEDHANKVIKLEKEAVELKRALTAELTEAGALLLSREDFLRLAATIGEIADFAGGIAFRISEISSRKWEAKKDIIDDLTKLSEATLDSVTRLRETVLSLSYSASRTNELAKNVESAEVIVDTLFRKIDLKIASSEMKMSLILILRDVAHFLEEIADKAEDAADAARILSLSAF